MNKLKEVIVVEGKSDTNHLRDLFGDVDTIETTGSSIDEQTLQKIEKAQKVRGVIVITDPDFNGLRIRKIINDRVPGVKNAFLNRKDAVPGKSQGSLGVEHADKASLEEAFDNLFTYDESNPSDITQQDLIEMGLSGQADSKQKREKVADKLKIGYGNTKQFLKELQMFQITKSQLQTVLKEIE